MNKINDSQEIVEQLKRQLKKTIIEKNDEIQILK